MPARPKITAAGRVGNLSEHRFRRGLKGVRALALGGQKWNTGVRGIDPREGGRDSVPPARGSLVESFGCIFGDFQLASDSCRNRPIEKRETKAFGDAVTNSVPVGSIGGRNRYATWHFPNLGRSGDNCHEKPTDKTEK